MNVKMYSVPEAIVSELNLKDYRQSDGKGIIYYRLVIYAVMGLIRLFRKVLY